jgi:type II secretory pathway component PulF
MPIEVSSTTAGKTERRKLRLEGLAALNARKPTARDRMFFTEQLSLLLETGTALHAALKTLKTQAENPQMVRVIAGLEDQIAEGKPFAAALQQYPDLFPCTYVNLVAAAEAGGFLDKVLAELLKMDERKEELRRTIVSALSYPVFLILFSIATVLFVLVVVFPKFADLFGPIMDQLPVTTLILMAASDTLIRHWFALSTGMLAALGWAVWWAKTPAGRGAVDRFKMRAWYLRDIFVQIYLTQSLRVLGLSLANGVSVMDALASCREVVSNRVFQQFISNVENQVQEGRGFSAAFRQEGFLPETVRQIVTTGEETGNLPRVLGRLADFYERELTKRLAAVARVIEPLMLLVMGAVVGLIVSSLILPIFKLSRAVT